MYMVIFMEMAPWLILIMVQTLSFMVLVREFIIKINQPVGICSSVLPVQGALRVIVQANGAPSIFQAAPLGPPPFQSRSDMPHLFSFFEKQSKATILIFSGTRSASTSEERALSGGSAFDDGEGAVLVVAETGPG